MELGDTVDLVGPNEGEVCHADHLRIRLLDYGYTREHLALLGEVPLYELQKVQVDVWCKGQWKFLGGLK